MDIYDHLPIYRRIEIGLKDYIGKKHLSGHAKLPSENVLAKEYNVNVGTVRKALNNLITENIIYRKHGIGTFVSPRRYKEKVLLVSNKEKISELSRIDYFDFFIGAVTEAYSANLPHEPVIVDINDFLNNINDLKFIYPDMAGIIFFRGMKNCFSCEKKLRLLKIPFMYYGPNIYGDLSSRFPCFYHDENLIADLAGKYFLRKGYKRIAGIFYASELISKARSALFQNIAASHALTYTPVCLSQSLREASTEYYRREYGKKFKQLISDNDAIFCFTDDSAIRIIQFIEKEIKKQVPGDIAVMGIDNIQAGAVLRPALTTVSIDNHMNGQEVFRNFSEYLSSHCSSIFTKTCPLKIIERESS